MTQQAPSQQHFMQFKMTMERSSVSKIAAFMQPELTLEMLDAR
jgi:hypothetical protein